MVLLSRSLTLLGVATLLALVFSFAGLAGTAGLIARIPFLILFAIFAFFLLSDK